MKICEGPECGRPQEAKGLCRTHYHQRHIYGKELKPIRKQKNTIPDEEHVARELAEQEARKRESIIKGPCTGPECDRDAQTMTPQPLCISHYNQIWSGMELRPLRHMSEHQPTDADERRCNTCLTVKPIDEFYKRSKTNKPLSECKFCAGKRNRITRLIREDRWTEAEALIKVWEAAVGENRNGWRYHPQIN